ncbi:MAG: thioesterase [Gammaproteobacteria bacterium]|nr:MAG: thioesterase [Gammaproteobacteria bacterium]
MLSLQQIKFRDDFLSPLKQKLFYLKNLPMGLLSGIRLIHLDENRSVTEVPYRWCNKNPFKSMYFAVQSMAAELSTAAPAIMALQGIDADVVFIIVDLKAEFIKKAQSKVTFTCLDYENIFNNIATLNKINDTITVMTKTVGRDIDDNEVAIFYFTWSFKRKS